MRQAFTSRPECSGDVPTATNDGSANTLMHSWLKHIVLFVNVSNKATQNFRCEIFRVQNLSIIQKHPSIFHMNEQCTISCILFLIQEDSDYS